MKQKILLILFFTLFLSPCLWAESIYLKSGKIIDGRIIDITKEYLDVDVGNNFSIRIPRDGIKRDSPAIKSFFLQNHKISVSPEVASLVQWMKTNVSKETQLPLSFYIPEKFQKNIYPILGKKDTITGIIERSIVKEGLEIYDGALWQIVLASLGGEENVELASLPVKVYWEGHLRNLIHIRAGFPGQPYIYSPYQINQVVSDLSKKGHRGFVFRIINANGNYNMEDPLDGKVHFEGFPNWNRIHWEDWKPIAGENAWIVMAALHIYHQKYYDSAINEYYSDEYCIELFLAEEIARAAMILQARNGGIRMAPLGTYYNKSIDANGVSHDVVDYDSKLLSEYMRLTERLEFLMNEKNYVWQDLSKKLPAEYTWYYDEISTENNLSWYAAFRMLYQITKKPEYKVAMGNVAQYFKSVWNDKENIFYQGAHFIEGQWVPNTEFFATDVQTWGIAVIGPEFIDEWFGVGSAMQIWKMTKKYAGYFDDNGNILGVGFTRENDRLSIEWTGGAILATKRLAEYYKKDFPHWAKEAHQDALTMRKGIDQFRYSFGEDGDAYSYSSRRGWIPFGWFSHVPEIMSLSSTSWVVLIDQNINPFVLDK